MRSFAPIRTPCSGAIARYDGFVAKFMGDGVLAYFGFPRAHEEDAERAVRAGLDIAAAVAQTRHARERDVEGPHRRRDRRRRGRRSRRTGFGAGTGRRRRHAQSGGAIAGLGRAGLRRRSRSRPGGCWAGRSSWRRSDLKRSKGSTRRFPPGRSFARRRTSAASRRRGRKA